MESAVLGSTVRDLITGFTGIVTGKVTYITGCNQVLVQPRVGEKGEFKDAHWIDEQRLELVPGEPIRLPALASEPTGFDAPAPIR